MSDEREEAAPDLVAGEEAAPDSDGVIAVGDGSAGLEAVESADLEEVEDGEEVEYEYVYEDENGNVIEAPDGEIDSEHYEEEIIDVIEGDEEGAQASDPSAPTVNIPAEKRPTRRIRSGSTRRQSGRQSARFSSRQVDPVAARKHARLKTLLLLGSIALIPTLVIAIALTYCYKKGWWPFRPAPKKVVVVMNDYHKGLAIYRRGLTTMRAAAKFYRNNDDARSYPLYGKAKRDFEKSRDMMQGWLDRHPGEGYSRVENSITQIGPLLRDTNDKIFMIEMRRGNKGGG